MVKQKLKPLSPTLKEKKRYLVFEVIAKRNLSVSKVKDTLYKTIHTVLGLLDSAKAGIKFLDNRYDEKTNKGILKVNHKYVDSLKFALMHTTKIGETKVIVKSHGVSGILKKAINNYI